MPRLARRRVATIAGSFICRVTSVEPRKKFIPGCCCRRAVVASPETVGNKPAFVR